MADDVTKKQDELDKGLINSLNNASSIITRDYLDRLETYELVVPSREDTDINIAECGKFYKLTKLVLNREENFLNKLTTIVNVASSIDCSLVTIICGDGYKIDFYFGILSKNARLHNMTDQDRREADAAAFKGALDGNLIGSELREMEAGDVAAFKDKVLSARDNCYSSVSGVVALRNNDDKSVDGYVQGIENLVDSLQGQRYTIVMLADPVSTEELNVMKEGYQTLYTQLSTFASSSVTINESDTVSISESRTEGISKGISYGVAMTQSKTKTQGKFHSVNASVGVDFGITANIGFASGINSSTAEQQGKTDTKNESTQEQKQKSNAKSASKMAGKSLQLTYENRSVQSLLDKINKNLERLDECESFGAFNCAAYVIAKERKTVLTVASNYNALMRGEDSSVQASHINSWYKPEETKIFGQYMASLVHPRFWKDRKNGLSVTPASMVSGDELAIQVGLPKKSVTGITVISMAPFGRNITESSSPSLELGNLYHMGHEEGSPENRQKVNIDIESLSMHTFITGSTGAGKSTAIYSMLDRLMEQKVSGKEDKITFLVIEPAKGEYKDRFGSYPNVQVYGSNDKKMPLLRINPFSFPDDVHVLEHIDRLIEIFNVCWPMYAAMPAVLKDAIERAYLVSGWNLDTSECCYVNIFGKALYPSFADVLTQINEVMEESAYSSDSKGDYKGALCTRLKSLTNGLYGQIFTTDELSSEELFDRNVIIDLSRTGSSETKSLIMGLLVMKLQEYRLANAAGGNAPLKHITVLEESHNILKRTSTEQQSEGANLLGKSVEMLANSIAEMRTYGEGFVIADQAPGLMDLSVIRNTNTKIILRLPDREDRELVGRAAGLNDDQISELSRLKTFVAAVYQNNWLEPVLCKIDTNFKQVPMFQYQPVTRVSADKNRIIDCLLMPAEDKNQLDDKHISDLIENIYALSIPAEAKIAFVTYLKATEKEEIQKSRDLVAYHIFNTQSAFGFAKTKENHIKGWYHSIRTQLEPDITMRPETEQKKIVAMLTKEKEQIYGENESGVLFNRLLNYI
ncbi:MAG: DUF87 domain-containing protein [Clostridiales bacterium]|nr:DUF87 domain-containing protein [Clostridiales bacterium]